MSRKRDTRCSKSPACARAFGGLVAVNDLGFAVAQGEIMGLLGPNGSGKTTVLNLMSGVLRPDAGTIRLMGRDIAGLARVPDRAARPGADIPARPRARRHGLPREHHGGAGVPEAASARRRGRGADRHAARARRPCRTATGGRRPTSPISTASGLSSPARSPPSRDLLLLDEWLAGLNPIRTA